MTPIRPDDRAQISRQEADSEAEPARLPREHAKSLKVVTGGSLTEAFAGAAAVILAILGLAGALPGYMASVGVILVGVAFLAQGGATAARWSRIVEETRSYDWGNRTDLGGGLSAEIFGGAAGVVLGVLALLGILPVVLIPVSLIVFGGTLLVGSGVTVDLGSVYGAHAEFSRVTREASMAASGTQVLVGVGAIVLGILALVGADVLILSLVGLLAVGASILLSGTAVSTRMIGILRGR